MSSTVYFGDIQVRSLQENNKPRYVVRGTALVANKKDIYEYTKLPNGKYKTMKSIFTPHCIESIKEQAKHKKLFVDTQHELARDASIKAILKDKLSVDENQQIDNMLKRKMLPLAKINDISIEDDKMDIETELNPMFSTVDADHKNWFDAVWYSLENKYLNGISINFGEFTYSKDGEGNMVIDDADVLGFSYVDNPASHDNSIYEVAIRSIEEKMNIRSGELKMEEEMEKLKAERQKLEDEKKQFETQKAEAEKKSEMEKQADEQKKIQQDIEAKALALKQAQEENVRLKDEIAKGKGIVQQKTPPYAQHNIPVVDGKFFAEKIKEITKGHDETMELLKHGKTPLIDKTFSGFAEMVNLQAQAGNLTADLDRKDAEFIQDHRLLEKSGSDIVYSAK